MSEIEKNKTIIPNFTKEEQEKYNPVYFIEGVTLRMSAKLGDTMKHKSYTLEGYGVHMDNGKEILDLALKAGAVCLRRAIADYEACND